MKIRCTGAHSYFFLDGSQSRHHRLSANSTQKIKNGRKGGMNGRKEGGCEGGGGNGKSKVMSQRKDNPILFASRWEGRKGGEGRVLQVENFEGFRAFF